MQNNGNTIAEVVEKTEPIHETPVSGYIMSGFQFALVIILIGIAIYFFSSKRKNKVESPKYTMMEDDEDEGK